MNQFVIIKEQTLNYGSQDQMYLMIIKIQNRFVIEVNSRTALIGRIWTRSRREAENMFSEIDQRMSAYSDIHSAIQTFDLAFTMKAVRPFMFVINYLNGSFDFNTIWKLKRVYGCITTPMAIDLIVEDSSYDNTIHITFPGYKFPLGFFKAPDADSNFTFYVNDYFLPQL